MQEKLNIFKCNFIRLSTKDPLLKVKHSTMKHVPFSFPHHFEDTEGTTNQNLHLQVPSDPAGPTRRVRAVAGAVQNMWDTLTHPAKSPCTKAPAPSGADSQVETSGYFCGSPELWITRTSAPVNKFRKEHCCLHVSQLSAQIQGMCPGIVHCLSTEAAHEACN